MAIDASPDMEGKFVVTHRQSENKLLADRFAGDEVHHGRLRYTCHWDTCPIAIARKKEKQTS